MNHIILIDLILRKKNTGTHVGTDESTLVMLWQYVIRGCIFYPFIPTVLIYSHKNVD